MSTKYNRLGFSTADIHDAQPGAVDILDLQFRCFGRHHCFYGEIETLKVFQDHAPVRDTVATEGRGRVLLVDGDELLRFGLCGDRIAEKAMANEWAGIVVVGAIRDSDTLDDFEIGIRALGTTARRSNEEREGLRGIPILVGGVLCRPGNFLYADRNAVLISPVALDVVPPETSL